MKKIIFSLAILVGSVLTNDCFAQNLPTINTAKKTFNVYMETDDDTPLIYGYESADLTSKKMICFSSMTADVDGNPHKCVLGAYYTTDEISIDYIATEGSFVKLKFTADGKPDAIFYIEKKMVKFE